MISFLEFNLINGDLMINVGVIYYDKSNSWTFVFCENIQLEFEDDFITDGENVEKTLGLLMTHTDIF